MSAGISCGGAGRCSTCWTKFATPRPTLSCGPPPSAQSMTFGAALSQLTLGRLSRDYGYTRDFQDALRRGDEKR